MIIGIDATNLRRGGGVTHLVELLRVAEPERLGIKRIVVWGGGTILKALEDRDWLEKRNPRELDMGLIRRTLWQRFRLSQAARVAKCDLLFVPGGSYAGSFHPVATMSRNLLPFEFREFIRYGWSLFTLKMAILRFTQSRSYRRVDGLIFLTEYAQKVVSGVVGTIKAKTQIIPHGLNPRFIQAPKVQRAIKNYNDVSPFRILYVSIIDQYKHQWHVVEAIDALRKQGLPIVLDLVGPAYPSALKRLKKIIDRLDANTWINYHGAIPFDELHLRYKMADIGLFASSCENMPNILLETMAAGLPIACSNFGPMPEILGDAGVYFNPEKPCEIAKALRTLIESCGLRYELANLSYSRAQTYSWKRCANTTFEFLVSLGKNYKQP